MEKTILIITDVEFWKKGAGHQTRISTLIRYLSIHTHLSVVFIGSGSDVDVPAISRAHGCTVDFLAKSGSLEIKEYGSRLEKYLDNRPFDFCIFEFLHLSYYTQYLSENTKIILDTNDILYKRYLSYLDYHHESFTENITRELEFQFFDLYDHILVISEPDLDLLKNAFPENKLLLCPHPPAVCAHSFRDPASNIGFVASENPPNVEGIIFFLNETWPKISAEFDISLAIYGNISRKLGFLEQSAGIGLKGFVPDLTDVYGEIDIAINPARFGAGLKIKNMEALANGIPLVTTAHGARGLEKAKNKAFFVADTPAETIACIRRLLYNPDLRKNMGEYGKRFILENFSPDLCFGELLRLIEQ
jgi:glycosyltransferase involved in cell wall biosynthesis